jgi:hypothetical protein
VQILDIARGLEYLHTGLDPNIIHGDLKGVSLSNAYRKLTYSSASNRPKFLSRHQKEPALVVSPCRDISTT